MVSKYGIKDLSSTHPCEADAANGVREYVGDDGRV